MRAVLKSLGITLIVTGAVAAIFWSLGYSFYRAAIFTFIGQLLFFYIFNTVLQYIVILKNKQIENERIGEFTKQGVDLECAHCNSKNLVPLRFDQDNEFTCLNCTKGNAVYINITTAQTTSPLDLQSLTTQAIIREKEAALNALEKEKKDDE